MKHLRVRMNLFKRVRVFQIELEFGSVGFWGEGKTEVPGEKPFYRCIFTKFLTVNSDEKLLTRAKFRLVPGLTKAGNVSELGICYASIKYDPL